MLTLLTFLVACDRASDADEAVDTAAVATADSGTEDGSTETDDDDTSDDDTDADTDADTDIDPSVSSICSQTTDRITCPHTTTVLYTGLTGLAPRQVHHQVPDGTPPPGGWPVAVLFQGSLFTAELFWVAVNTDVLGFWSQGLLTKGLLDAGYAVVTPEAHAQGGTFWDTNVPPWSSLWTSSPDNAFMLDMFAAIDDGVMGDLNGERMYATGISSGGYMTSRMNSAYPERFRALAVQSASYQDCAGPLCTVPAQSADHLPTLFLHGEDDSVVPMSTMEPYHQALVDAGVDTNKLTQPGVGHAWIDAAPTGIVDWFDAHP